jgi:hypothetical protein
MTLERLMIPVTRVRIGDHLITTDFEDPTTERTYPIMEEPAGVDVGGGPKWRLTVSKEGHYREFDHGDEVAVYRDVQHLQHYDDDQLKKELDRRRRARQVNDLHNVLELLDGVTLEVRSIQSEHWVLRDHDGIGAVASLESLQADIKKAIDELTEEGL